MNTSKYDPTTLWPTILTAIANGRSLASILREEGMPGYTWAKVQLRQNAELRQAYDQALEDRADTLADELVELADQLPPDDLDGPSKSAWVQQLKLRLWARTWAASKLRPRIYGDRLDVGVSHTQISITAALEAAHNRVLTLNDNDTRAR